MRFLSFLAAVLVSAPACAQYTDTIQLAPGSAMKWQAPKPFTQVIVGNPDIIDVVQAQTNRQLIITKKPPRPTNPGGTTNPDAGITNLLLLDANGDQVANVLVTNPGLQYDLVQSRRGTWQVYRRAAPEEP